MRLCGLSAAVPARVVETGPEHARFREMSGIERRRICPEGMFMGDLAEAAATPLLDLFGRSTFDSLIVVTQTPDMRVPAMACMLQSRLGLPSSCAAFDINLGCSGYVYGLSVASNFSAARSLLIVGEITGKLKEHSYQPMFGDAVTASVLAPQSFDGMQFDLCTDGSRFDAITERAVDGNPPAELKLDDRGRPVIDKHYVLKGPDIYRFALRSVPTAVREMALRSATPLEKLDSVVFHQASKMVNDSLAKRLKLRPTQVPSTLRDFGNVSSATIPLTMVHCLRDKLQGEEFLPMQLCGFGVGLSWGTAFGTFGQMYVPELIEL